MPEVSKSTAEPSAIDQLHTADPLLVLVLHVTTGHLVEVVVIKGGLVLATTTTIIFIVAAATEDEKEAVVEQVAKGDDTSSALAQIIEQLLERVKCC